MQFIAGLIVAFISITFSIFHLRQDFSHYYDPIGFALVLGGTLAVATITLPWHQMADVRDAFKNLFGNAKADFKTLNQSCFAVVQSAQNGQAHFQPSENTLAHQILADGVELIQLGFTSEKINSILDERIHQWGERKQKIANAIRSLAKYPPAFGLMGTVFGLMSLMRAISEGASSNETGVRMAVALVATLYGLVTANLVINPAGENILKKIQDEKKGAEIALRAILMAADHTNLLEAQETLNSYVSKNERLNQFGFNEAGAA